MDGLEGEKEHEIKLRKKVAPQISGFLTWAGYANKNAEVKSW